MNRTYPIDGELLKLKEEIESYATAYGLTFPEVRFEVCDYDTINILAAQGGFPTRYPHWSFGMQYDQLSKGYAYGMQKIYEMVINTDPCYAYLLKANHLVDQKIVMAHVYGHADFFKNNYWFSGTNRNMMDVMANHGTKIRRYMEKYGQDKVEAFVDKVLSLENLLDPQVLFQSQEQKKANDKRQADLDIEFGSHNKDDGLSTALRSFMGSREREANKKKIDFDKMPDELTYPVEHINLPTKDILMFLMENAPLEEWEADVIGILREEAYYFLPQRMTKIMNEGWASYWHSTIMTQKALRPSEIIDFADHHSGVMAMSRQRLNPYKVGIELMRDIEYRWDTGKFGKEYNECPDMREKANWNQNLGLGRQKIFEVRKTHNDITFIDEFLTQEFCDRQQIFTYKYNPRTGRNEIESKDFMDIKDKLLSSLTNFGQPVIHVESANYNNRSELMLRHTFAGVPLDIGQAHETIRNLFFIWKRPVNLITMDDNREVLYHFDGKEMKIKS